MTLDDLLKLQPGESISVGDLTITAIDVMNHRVSEDYLTQDGQTADEVFTYEQDYHE